MAVSAKVGSFAKATGAAPASQAITGVGFQPKVVIFWSATGTVSGTFIDAMLQGFGLASSTTNERSISTAADDNVNPSQTSRNAANKVVTFRNGTPSVVAECDLTSFDTDGFTVSWSTNNATAYLIHYLALGGADLQAAVLDWTIPTTATTKAVTGAGFQPQMLVHMSTGASSGVPATGNLGQGCVGCETATSSWVVAWAENDSATPTVCARKQQTGKSAMRLAPAGTTSWEGVLSTFDSDGFTFNLTTAVGVAEHVYTLCLRGASFAVGSSAKPTGGNGSTQAISGLGFRPSAYVLASGQSTAGAGGVTGVKAGFGASDGTSEQASTFESQHNVATSNTSAVDKTDKVFVKVNNDAKTIDAEADHTSMDTDGFTLTWPINDAVATEMLWMAFGPPEIPPGVHAMDIAQQCMTPMLIG